MPRSGDGSYTLPDGTIVASGDTILVSQHNPPMSDIAVALTGSLSRDGLGGMNAALAMGNNKITGGVAGTNPTDFAIVSQLSVSDSMPIGSVVDFAGTAAPSGWLICAGQSILRASYSALFTAIGTTYGSVSGTTFNLPDCRGRVVAGLDVNSGGFAGRLSGSVAPSDQTSGSVGGAKSVSLTVGQLAAHTHTGSTATAGAHMHFLNAGGGSFSAQAGAGDLVSTVPPTATTSAGDHTHTMALDNTGSGDAHPNVQPVIVMLKIIKSGV